MVGQDDFTVATKKSNVDLVIVTTVELDSKNRVTFEKICRFAMEHGLKLCSPEVGPLLRLQYQDEPLGEWFMIAMEQITNLGRPPSVFRVGRNGGGLWLRSWCGHPDYFRRANNPWIFVKPRK
ncbi:MAG: hypothetical protein ABII13_00400 [Patescibacteria group bacterium]|nr:hypothetical protein [Patescibacteria group bacterium]MBU2509560.1 hypothetical protein [Patescibacteria group bacterium]